MDQKEIKLLENIIDYRKLKLNTNLTYKNKTNLIMSKKEKKKEKELKIKWLEIPEEHDYPAAESYLGLIYSDTKVKSLVKELENAEMTSFKAKDIFRASKLSLLGVSNSHVEKNLQKIMSGKKMSPLLLVRDKETSTVIVADGYHRLCSVYTISEDIDIPCKIV